MLISPKRSGMGGGILNFENSFSVAQTKPMSWPRPRRGGRAGASRSILPSWWPRGEST